MHNFIMAEKCRGPAPSIDLCSVEFIVTTVALGIIDFVVITGNSLVILAAFKSHRLQRVTNLFIVSLATSDLLLGCAVLPFSITNEVLGHYWIFGETWCSIWLAIDVWVCTASILNLCIISFDRYLAITRPIRYMSIMTKRKARFLIALCWILSFIICFPPLIGWNEHHFGDVFSRKLYTPEDMPPSEIVLNKTQHGSAYTVIESDNVNASSANTSWPKCDLVSEPGYRIYSAMGSFYIPMCILLFFYGKIYKYAKQTNRSIRRGRIVTKAGLDTRNSSEDLVTLRIHKGRSSSGSLPWKAFKRKSKSNCTDQYDFSPTSSVKQQGSVDSDQVDDISIHREDSNLNGGNTKLHSAKQENFHKRGVSSDSLAIFSEMGVHLKPHEILQQVNDTKPQNKCSSNDRASPRHEPHTNGTMKQLLRKRNIRSYVRRLQRETKAAKTLAIIVGAFIFCWLPFFTIYLIGAFCSECIPDMVFNVVFWIGYCNSAINPCIYALFSKDYRDAFKNLLVCRKRSTKHLNHLTTTFSHNHKQSVIVSSNSVSGTDSDEHDMVMQDLGSSVTQCDHMTVLTHRSPRQSRQKLVHETCN